MAGKTMTKEQKIFKVGLRKLDEYDEIRLKRPLKEHELAEENKIKEVLFATVKRYGISVIRSMTQKYRLSSDAYQDLYQDLAIIFYEKYRDYNPDITTPTTYFVRYFRQKVSEYLVENMHKLTAYDANNVLKVRRAIAYYESKGVKWTEEMLSIRTDLSLKVVHSTIIFSYASNYASVEEAYELKSHIKTPEEYFAEKESHIALLRAIQKNTTEEELQLLMMRVNPDGVKEMPYEKIAEQKGMPVREVKKKINTCICRLNQDKELLEHFSKPTLKKYKSTLSLQRDVSSVMENHLQGFLEEMAMHN